MKKNNKKIKSMLIVFCMMVCTLMGDIKVTQADSGDAKVLQDRGRACEGCLKDNKKKYQLESASQQENALNAYQELRTLLGENEAVRKVYAGSYIGEDNILVVQLTTASQEIKDVVQKSTKSQEVKFEQRVYTYDELMETYKKISNALNSTKEYSEFISSVSVNVMKNAVIVGLRNLSYKDTFLANICDDKCIQFIKSDIKYDSSVKVGTTRKIKNMKYIVTKKTDTVREVTVKSIEQKSKKTVTIPATVTIDKKTYKVVGIEKNAFKGMKKLKTIIIGKNVRTIGNRAFMNCKKLDTVKILSKKCSISGKSIWKGTSKKLVVKVPKSVLKKMRKMMKKSGLKASAVKALN